MSPQPCNSYRNVRKSRFRSEEDKSVGQGDNPVNILVQKPQDTRQGHRHDTTNVKCSRCDGKHTPSEC